MDESNSLIPKIIHYCWFGPNKMSSVQKKCIKSWKENLPDFEFKLWDETNTNFDHSFIEYAYKNNKWAFVTDLVRLRVLYEDGGIYLDTDMLLFKSLNIFLNDSCFFGTEDEDHISCGIIGAIPKHPFIGECIKEYDTILSAPLYNWKNVTIPKIVTKIFRQNFNFTKTFNSKINLKNLTIYPPIYFYSLSYSNRFNKIRKKEFESDRVYAIHLWDESWIDLDSNSLLRKRNFFKALCKFGEELNYRKNYNPHFFLSRLRTMKRVIFN